MADLYQPENAQVLIDRFLRDVRLGAIDAGVDAPPTQPGSDWHMTATAVANLCMIGFANLNSLETSRDVFGATGEDLDAIREADGLSVVEATGASGRIVISVSGATTIPAGLQFTLPNRLRGQVSTGAVNPADQSELDVEMIDTGEATNLGAGEEVEFVSPPINLAATAVVSEAVPLTGGYDDETDERKRDRILQARRNRPAGGNWAYLREVAVGALGSVQDAYVYPAYDGVGTVKVVPVRRFDRTIGDYSRELSEASLSIVRSAIHAKVPAGDDIAVQAADDQLVDFALEIEIPDAVSAGGSGQGWTDTTPWPVLESSDAGNVQISAITSDGLTVTVDAVTSTSPTAGQSNVAWWSSTDQRFYRALVVSVSGMSGAWVLGLDQPFIDSRGNVATVGDYISPAAEHLEAYGATWVTLFESLGPGEQVASPTRERRRPYATVEDPATITNATITSFVRAHAEVTDAAFVYSPTTTPTVPGDVDTAPKILVCRRFGLYPL